MDTVTKEELKYLETAIPEPYRWMIREISASWKERDELRVENTNLIKAVRNVDESKVTLAKLLNEANAENAKLKAENELKHRMYVGAETDCLKLENENAILRARVAESKESIKGMGHKNNDVGRWVCKFIRYGK